MPSDHVIVIVLVRTLQTYVRETIAQYRKVICVRTARDTCKVCLVRCMSVTAD